jgi:hypothetical protein
MSPVAKRGLPTSVLFAAQLAVFTGKPPTG